MTTAAEKLASLHSKLVGQKHKAAELGAVYKFVLHGEGGGTWLMNLKDQVGVAEGDGEADCVLSMAADDLVELLEGRRSAQQLFFSGRLRVEGDMGVAVRLQRLPELLA